MLNVVTDLIFKSSLNLNWGEIYFGIKKGFFKDIDVRFLIEENQIKPIISKKRMNEYLALEGSSFFEKIDLIKGYIYEDFNILIEHNEPSIVENDLQFIDDKFKTNLRLVNQINILTCISKLNISTEEKFYKLYLVHGELEYDKNLEAFAYFYFKPYLNYDTEKMYSKFLIYLSSLKYCIGHE